VEEKLGGAKIFDFRRTIIVCFGYRLLKHKMTRYAKNLGGHGSLGRPGYAYALFVEQHKHKPNCLHCKRNALSCL